MRDDNNRHDNRAPFQLYGRFDDKNATLADVVKALASLPHFDRYECAPQEAPAAQAGRALDAIVHFAAAEAQPDDQPLLMHVGDFLNGLHHLLDLFTDDAGVTLEELVHYSLKVHYGAEIREW